MAILPPAQNKTIQCLLVWNTKTIYVISLKFHVKDTNWGRHKCSTQEIEAEEVLGVQSQPGYRVRCCLKYKQTNMLIKCSMSSIVSFRINKHIWAGWEMQSLALLMLSLKPKSACQPLLYIIRVHIWTPKTTSIGCGHYHKFTGKAWCHHSIAIIKYTFYGWKLVLKEKGVQLFWVVIAVIKSI